MASLLGIKKLRSLNSILYIRLIIYVRFKQVIGCLYIYNGKKTFSKTQMYYMIFGVTEGVNKHIKIMGNMFFNCLSIQYFFWKSCQL